MPLRIALDNYYVVLLCAITVIISLFITFYIFIMAKKNQLLYLYLLTQLMLILWVFSKILKTAAPNIHLRWFFIVTQYLGICFLGSIYVMFAYTYSRGRFMQLRYAVSLNVIPAILFIIILTNPLHMMFYSYFDMYRDSFGPLFYIHQIITYLYLVSGIVLCSKDFRKQFGHRRMQATLFTVAILLPIAVNLLYVFKVLKIVFGIRLPMDITPISCIISLLIFAIAAFKYRFVDITPMAYKEVLRQSTDGILLVDKTGLIIERNEAFDLHFCHHLPSDPITTIKDFLNILTKYMKFTGLPFASGSLDHMLLTAHNAEICLPEGLCFKVLIEPVFVHKKRYCGALIRFIDDSSRKKILDLLTWNNSELAQANHILEKKAEVQRQLTVARVRSFMAKEVHDILGHTVVLVVAMLEVALLKVRNGNQDVLEYIDHSIGLLKKGLIELENSTRENRTSKTENVSLFQSLQLLAGQLKSSGIVLEITVQGQSHELDSKHTDNIYRICREAVTNSVRHGKATLINIIFRFYSNRYELYILDNGIGCQLITMGMGLKGMEEKASELGASLHYSSSTESGFHIFFSSDNGTSLVK